MTARTARTTSRYSDEDPDENYEVQNIYSVIKPIEKQYKQKSTNLSHPCRILITGPSGSGKTNLVTNIALDLLAWNDLTVYARNPDQPVFRFLGDSVDLLTGNPDCFHINNEIDRDVSDFDQKKQHLVIFDDLAMRGDKATSMQIEKFCKAGRPQNISVIVISQGFYDTLKNVRENISVYCAFKPRNPYDVRAIHGTYCTDVKLDQFEDILNRATTKEFINDQNSFLTVYVDEPNQSKKYRRGFKKAPLIEPVPEPRSWRRPW